MKFKAIWMWICALGLFVHSVTAVAHQVSDSYLKISESKAEATSNYNARWHLGLKDLEMAVGIDGNHDGSISWGEVKAAEETIKQYAISSLQVTQEEKTCEMLFSPIQIQKLSSGVFVSLDFTLLCLQPGFKVSAAPLKINYSPFFDIDQSHRGIVNYQSLSGEWVQVIGPDNTELEINTATNSTISVGLQFIKEGIWHIWIGIDHILFLLALLIPTVLFRSRGAWQPHDDIKPVLIDVLKLVTSFTLAHSITLMAATLNWISLSSSVVETIIALSVVLAGLHILFPLQHDRRWLFVFLFGLIHGFGFASVLSDLSLPTQAFWASIVGFNIGVEIGQLVIVLILLPVFYGLRRTRQYQQWLMPSGAVMMMMMGSVWAIERSLSLTLLES